MKKQLEMCDVYFIYYRDVDPKDVAAPGTDQQWLKQRTQKKNNCNKLFACHNALNFFLLFVKINSSI